MLQDCHCFLLELSDQVNQFTDSEQLEFDCWSRSPAPCFLFSADAISRAVILPGKGKTDENSTHNFVFPFNYHSFNNLLNCLISDSC